MKKLMALTAMLALMLATAAPAFADHWGDLEVGGDLNATFVDASQVQVAAAWQTNEGDATAEGDESEATIEQSLTIEQSQVNAGLGGVAAGGDIIWLW